MIGRTIGNYTLIEKLGQGGMGEVYLAEHRRIARRAAIKFLLPALSQDADVVNRFFNEARAASLIKHSGIVEIYDCDAVDGQAYIVMEYLEGESLAVTLRRAGALAGEPTTIAAVVGQIASALAAAHHKEIIHRDLKPENVFLSVNDTIGVPFVAKILDFGIAKLAAPGAGGSNTRTGGLLGTPIYMSPEQCRGITSIDRRADVYALGCVMFELATGRHVFVKEAAGDLLVAHIIETPPRISAFRPEIPSWMDDLVNRMLAKGPDDRPSTMDEVISTMESFLQVGAADFGTRIPATSALARIPTQGSRPKASATLPATTPRTAPRSRSHPHDAMIPAIGGTRILPAGVPPPDGEATNDSTFRRSAAELIPEARDLRPAARRVRLVVVATGGLVVAGLAAFLLTRSKPAPPLPASPPVEPALAAPSAAAPPPPPTTRLGAPGVATVDRKAGPPAAASMDSPRPTAPATAPHHRRPPESRKSSATKPAKLRKTGGALDRNGIGIPSD
jgi:serine/threonine-protein kinase